MKRQENRARKAEQDRQRARAQEAEERATISEPYDKPTQEELDRVRAQQRMDRIYGIKPSVKDTYPIAYPKKASKPPKFKYAEQVALTEPRVPTLRERLYRPAEEALQARYEMANITTPSQERRMMFEEEQDERERQRMQNRLTEVAKHGSGMSPWIRHVKAYQKKHGCSYKEALKGAKSTY